MQDSLGYGEEEPDGVEDALMCRLHAYSLQKSAMRPFLSHGKRIPCAPQMVHNMHLRRVLPHQRAASSIRFGQCSAASHP